MKGSMSTDLGIITIDPEVIAKYAGSVAVECFGIVGMAAVSMKDGLVKLLKKESLTKGIQVGISDENKITLNFHVVVAYGVSISAVTDNLISNVKYKVEEFTGMSVDKINIYIEGVRVIDELRRNLLRWQITTSIDAEAAREERFWPARQNYGSKERSGSTN